MPPLLWALDQFDGGLGLARCRAKDAVPYPSEIHGLSMDSIEYMEMYEEIRLWDKKECLTKPCPTIRSEGMDFGV
jgi:hypothetical protein